ncbi:MAG: ion channel [bacterium]|nr:two pore domain potassium channel family protein [Gammaproteobacteria bacterium]HIL96247.1 two pore domain potassium channel family protein [Pseudomonadales bacterium]
MSAGTKEPPFGFEVLLISFVFLLFIPDLFDGEFSSFVSRILSSFILVSSLYIVVLRRKDFIIGLLLAVPTALSGWLPAVLVTEGSQLLVFSVFKTAFLAYISFHILRYLLNARQVDAEIIYAAVCLYLLMGMTWALIYFGIILVNPEAISLKVDTYATDSHSVAILLKELVYFSYVTQTTLGYGDLTPTSGLARAIVITQALFGQIYIAVIIARLVGLQIATAAIEESK